MSTKLRRHLLADINKAELYAGLQPICHTTQFLYDPIFIHYRLLNGLSAGHVRGYGHAWATSMYTIIVFFPTVQP